MSKFMRLRDYILYVSTQNRVEQEFWIYNQGLEDIYTPDGQSLEDIIQMAPKPPNDMASAIVNQAIVNLAIAI